MNRYGAGALAGLLATVPMTLAMDRLYRRLPPAQQYPLPPHGITRNFLRQLGLEDKLTPDQVNALTLALHFGFGAFAGALYALIRQHPERTSLVEGMVYGVGVWGASYLGWVPAAHLLNPATRHPKQRVEMMILVHLIWGPVTTLLTKYLHEAGSSRSRLSQSQSEPDHPQTESVQPENPSARLRHGPSQR